METVKIYDVQISRRMRRELGDIEQLSKSISDNGLINPITLAPGPVSFDDIVSEHPLLVAGQRRLEALKKLGIVDLEHGIHFLWRDDLSDDEYRRTAVELEENIRRKAMTWHEEVLGKQKLLEVYQRIYGAPVPGQPTRSVQQGLKPAGFGVRKLAELLNEDPAQTSRDLDLAALVTKLPILKNESSREDAKRKLVLAVAIQSGKAGPHVAKPLVYKILVECDSEQHQGVLLAQFRTAGLKCQAIVS